MRFDRLAAPGGWRCRWEVTVSKRQGKPGIPAAGYADPMHVLASLRASSRSPLLQVVKTSVAAIIAWLLCVILLQQQLPIFAAIAALLVVQPSVNQSLAKGIERSVGVVLGVILAYGAGALFGHSSGIVLTTIVISLLIAWLLRLSPGSANQIPISAMLVIAIGTSTPGYAVNRIIETVIGAAVGLAINAIIVPPVLMTPAHSAVIELAHSVARTLRALSSALQGPRRTTELGELMSDARALRGLRDTATEKLTRAGESLMLNPRQGRHRRLLDHDRRLLDTLGILVTRTTGMARALQDNYDESLHEDAFVQSISVELERAAHDLLLLVSDPTRAADTTEYVEPLALTAPLAIAQPDPQNWVLIGSLLEDLRRVREEIVGDRR